MQDFPITHSYPLWHHILVNTKQNTGSHNGNDHLAKQKRCSTRVTISLIQFHCNIWLLWCDGVCLNTLYWDRRQCWNNALQSCFFRHLKWYQHHKIHYLFLFFYLFLCNLMAMFHLQGLNSTECDTKMNMDSVQVRTWKKGSLHIWRYSRHLH